MNYPPEIREFLQAYDSVLLDERGIIKLFPAEFYHSLDNTDLRVWCICRAIYQLPTVELIEWLQTNFDRSTTRSRKDRRARHSWQKLMMDRISRELKYFYNHESDPKYVTYRITEELK